MGDDYVSYGRKLGFLYDHLLVAQVHGRLSRQTNQGNRCYVVTALYITNRNNTVGNGTGRHVTGKF